MSDNDSLWLSGLISKKIELKDETLLCYIEYNLPEDQEEFEHSPHEAKFINYKEVLIFRDYELSERDEQTLQKIVTYWIQDWAEELQFKRISDNEVRTMCIYSHLENMNDFAYFDISFSSLERYKVDNNGLPCGSPLKYEMADLVLNNS